MEEIDVLSYYGNYALAEINSILTSSNYDIQKTIKELESFKEERDKIVLIIENTRLNLDALKIDPHYHKNTTFEVGILIPKELTDNKIVLLTKELNKWDKVLKTFRELAEGETEDTEISFVSNGSLQFFIDNSPQVAMCLAMVLERVAKLYKNIIEIREAREKLKTLGISPVESKFIEKQEKDQFNKEIEKISTDLVKQFAIKNIETGRLNELKIAVKGHVTYICKCVDSGITIEITPPEVNETALKEESEKNGRTDDDHKAIHSKTKQQIDIALKSMELIKSLGKTGLDIMKYLNNPSEEGSSETDESIEE
jgi:hypothetical protein